MRKKLLIAALIILTVTGGSGCAMLKITSEKEKIVSRMEEKYGEDFRFVEWQFKKLGSENCAAHLECDSLPGQLIKAGKKIVPDGEAVYYDNYMGCKYEDEIQTELEHAVRNVYPRSRVIFLTASSQFPDNMGPEMSVEDIIQDRDTLLAAVIVAEEKWDAARKETRLDNLRQELEDRKIRLDGNLFVTQDEAACARIDETNYHDWISREDWFSGRCYFAMDKAYEFYYANWR